MIWLKADQVKTLYFACFSDTTHHVSLHHQTFLNITVMDGNTTYCNCKTYHFYSCKQHELKPG